MNKSNWIRFAAGVLASVLLVSAFALTGGMKSGKSTDGLMYQASGLHPDGEMLVIDGQTVSCEEYLYWVAYTCYYISSRIPDVDWNAVVTEDGMTYGEYVKVEAVNSVKQYTVTRSWAQQAGIALSDEDRQSIAQQLVTYYGGEEGYQRQLALVGISREANDAMMEAQYLSRALYQSVCTPGGALYDEAALSAYAVQHNYGTFYILTLSGENAETMAADLLERWQNAEDKPAEYAAMCDELQQEAGSAVTLAAMEGDPLSDAITALEIEELTAVIDPYEDGSCYLALRTELDLSAVAEPYFEQMFQEKLDNAAAIPNSKLYNGLDVGDFYEKLTQLRQELMASMAADEAQTDTPEDTQPDGDADSGGAQDIPAA